MDEADRKTTLYGVCP